MVVYLDDDADTDDQEEDQECRPLLCHPRPHPAPAESESTGGNWGNQRWDSPYRAKVKCSSCRVLSTCDCFVSAPRAPADSLNLILCDPVIVFWAIFPRCLCCDVGPVTAAGPTGRHARSTLIYAGACHSCTPIGETSANRPRHAHAHTHAYIQGWVEPWQSLKSRRFIEPRSSRDLQHVEAVSVSAVPSAPRSLSPRSSLLGLLLIKRRLPQHCIAEINLNCVRAICCRRPCCC